MRLRSSLGFVLGCVLALGIVMQSAAQPATYSRSRNPIKCGVLLLPSTANINASDPYYSCTDSDPYVFYNLTKRTDLLPSGWDFVNPYAPSVVTARIHGRWTALNAGDPIQKNMAPYWEVYLPELTDHQIGSYNVLLIHALGNIWLRPEDRERLRRFVDAGGILWFDRAAGQTIVDSAPVLLSFDFNQGGVAGVVNAFHPLLTFPHKLTFSEASHLGTEWTNANGMVASGAFPTDLYRFAAVTANGAGPVIADADFGGGHFVVTGSNVVSMINEPAGGTNIGLGPNSGPYAGKNFLNIPTPALKFAYNVIGLVGTHKQFGKDSRKTDATYDEIHAPLFPKWAAMGSAFTPQANSSDHHGNLYHPPVIFKGLVIVATANMVYAFDEDPQRDLDGDGNPDDGQLDALVPGFGPGWTADLVWSWPCPPHSVPLSSPMCVEIPVSTSSIVPNVPLDQVWVMGADGVVYLLNAFPYDPFTHKLQPQQVLGGPANAIAIDPPTTDGSQTIGTIQVPSVELDSASVPNALTYADGVVFAAAAWVPTTSGVSGPPGAICWPISATAARKLQTGLNLSEFYVARYGTGANFDTLRGFNTSPCIANVPQSDNGDGSDQMVYLGTDRDPPVNSGGASPGFAALWFRSHGEKLSINSYDPNPSNNPQNTATYRTRASNIGLGIAPFGSQSGQDDFRDLKLRAYAISLATGAPPLPGDPVIAAMQTAEPTGGSSDIAATLITINWPQGVDARNYAVYADYTIDWKIYDKAGSSNGNLGNIARTKALFADQNIPRSDVIKSLAVAPNGNLFIVTSERDVDGRSSTPPGPYGIGSLYCIKERLNGSKVLYRWVLHNKYNQFITRDGSTMVPVPPAIVDADDLVTKLVQPLNQELTKLHFHGSPTIYNNMVYLVASARKSIAGFPVPVTIVLAFDSDPAPAEIRLGGPVTGDPGQLTLQQPDITSETTDRANPRQSVVSLNNAGQQMDIDLAQGIIHVNSFFNIPSRSLTRNLNSLSTSQPVLVRFANSQSPTLLDPNTTGSHWSPLRWYMTFNGFGNQSPVMVTGGTLYLAGGSVLGSFLGDPGGPSQGPTFKSVVFAIDSDVATNDEFMITDPVVPTNTVSNHQLMWLKIPAPGAVKADPHIRWPSFAGLTDATTWRSEFSTRLNQCTLSPVGSALGAIGGDAVLVAWDGSGLYVFDRALTMVVDEGRASEVDSEGFADWTTQNTYAYTGDVSNLGVNLNVARLAAPTKAYKLSSNEYLIVDTAANRIVRMDRAGFELRSVTGFTLAKMTQTGGNSLLGFSPGDPLTLNQPQDAMVWTEYILAKDNPFLEPAPAAIEFWTHYLIADTGNGRLVDVVDRQRADGNFAVYEYIAQGQIVYHSPLNAFGRRYRYATVSRIPTGTDSNGYPSFVIVSSVSNWEMGGNSIGTWNNPPTVESFTGSGNVLIERFDSSLALKDRLVLVQTAANPTTGAARRLVGQCSAQVFAAGWDISDQKHPQALIGILIADQLGVVVFKQVAAGNFKDWQVAWEMTDDDYFQLRGVPLRAVGARKLSNGDILITNAYVGQRVVQGVSSPFSGEVLEVFGSAYRPTFPAHGFTPGCVIQEIPPLSGASPLRTPLFADRQ